MKKKIVTDYTFDGEQNLPFANEPAISFFTTASTIPNSWVILNHATQKPESRLSSFEKMARIKDGISKQDLEDLKTKADFDYNQLSKIFSVARATLINKKGKEKLLGG